VINEETNLEENKTQETKERVIRAPQTQAITEILQKNNISISQTKNQMGGRKVEDTKVETKKKLVVRKQTNILFLQNNEIRSILGMASVLEAVMYNSQNLIWLDLSYNYLENIEEELLNFRHLKTLYLHGNYFSNIEQVRQLNAYDDLQSLTLYGNPIE